MLGMALMAPCTALHVCLEPCRVAKGCSGFAQLEADNIAH